MKKQGSRSIWRRLMLPHKYHRASKENPSDREPDTEAADIASSALHYSPKLGDANPNSLSAAHVYENARFPSTDEQMAGGPDNSKRTGNHGWLAGVSLCVKGAALILLVNLVFIAVVAGMARKYPTAHQFSGSQIFYEGDCTLTSRWSTALHLIINILSTGILAASNYCMQTLVAPTREEIDSSHAQGKWLDIGTPSLRNLKVIPKHRVALWLVLLVTATPFHLMYNSMVFESMGGNVWSQMIGPTDLSSENVMNLTTPGLQHCFELDEMAMGTMTWTEFSSDVSQGTYNRISAAECVNFMTKFNAAGAKLLMMLTDELSVRQGGNEAILSSTAAYGLQALGDVDLQSRFVGVPFANTTTTDATGNPTCFNSPDYKTFGFTECLQIPTPQHCQLLYNPTICIVISLCTLAKITAMLWAARASRFRSAPILTVGDAVASFVTKPDLTTRDMCWISKRDVRHQAWGPSHVAQNSSERLESTSLIGPAEYRKLMPLKRLINVPGKTELAAVFFWCLATVGAGAALFQISIERSTDFENNSLTVDLLRQWGKEGLGANDNNLVTTSLPARMLDSVVVANIPQLIITMSYYGYNNVMTTMLAAAEYDSYGVSHKPLRVTWPKKDSQQKSTYWLSIPYHYAVPILLLYMVLHWLISQSIFYVIRTPYTAQGEALQSYSVKSLGFAQLPIFCAILVGSFMILILILLSLKRFKSNMPLAGSCSAVISAACHPPKYEDSDSIALGLVKWGEITASSSDEVDGFRQEIDDGKGHCSFTGLDTVQPSLTKLYA
ncbi:unnamed protein product [Penicillium salamii]|uniref:DUF6536 domain-containing protein n=1 Tax=Penicillium salamii TaxID=1612424 RepID=A0A9W4IQQ8_9EURO|nr:unnamed protein product [Penicillium salamii]CAG8007628.1 unnamed protein product [Penicillium salamii]CAG8054623.1 unnamed protein product [Penicillium salamii]CAG8217043.1 unnamed protein product [Penicillium salamii]CAG8326567.1 unnamed protein product [Penicillium salamii]